MSFFKTWQKPLTHAMVYCTANHSILLIKLEHYGIRGIPLLRFKNDLSKRKQYVQFKGTNSKVFDIICGVPQGSVLGSRLFLINLHK